MLFVVGLSAAAAAQSTPHWAFEPPQKQPERQEIVVLAQVLADAVNVGYEPFHNDVVVAVNGHAPVDMRDFVRAMDAAQGEVVLKLSSGATVLLDADEARAAAERILSRYRVSGDRSPDLRREEGRAAAR
ncbi:MAG: hypothetical protein ABIP94_12930 [Planctomycetota bacterium]